MDSEQLKKIMLREANLDLFDGTGRIFIDDFTEAYGVTRQEFFEGLENIGFETRIHGDRIALIYFAPLTEKLETRRKEMLEADNP